MANEGASVSVDNLSFFYAGNGGRVEALRNISFSAKKGDICTIIGPSASGKSTLLYILAGLLPFATGGVLINGKRPFPGQRTTSLILQNFGLLPWKTIWDNVTLGLVIRRLSKSEIREKGEKILMEMGLAGLSERYPAELSGGQQQRVAIARSLATEPELLLMDEPFSSLDALTREAMQEVLQNILQTRGLTVMLVTHSIEEAAFLGHRIIVLTGHPGAVYRIFDNPRAGSPNYRKSDDFFHLSTQLRGAMEFVQSAAPLS
ncbi:MAG: ABC transporter ATP-binding protein [Syntrophales bacterium]|jgi:NitT/TauT family transport system ATP-binding protein|nr:ABC transporter ATP-binding protein [Syntrophales bacterium]